MTETNAISNTELIEKPSQPAVASQPKPKPVCILKLYNIHNNTVCILSMHILTCVYVIDNMRR